MRADKVEGATKVWSANIVKNRIISKMRRTREL